MAQGNKVRFNLKNVHYATFTTGENGAPVFAKPIPIPGGVSISLSPEGDTTPFYADGIPYYVTVANNGYSGELEVALIPDSFRTEVLGENLDETDKVIVEQANIESKTFALLFQFDGDVNGICHVFYNCTATRPNIEGSTTTESKEPSTETISLTASPLSYNNYVKAKTGADTTDEVRNKWFQSVWMPKIPSSEIVRL